MNDNDRDDELLNWTVKFEQAQLMFGLEAWIVTLLAISLLIMRCNNCL